jgi:hypothetical protein
VASRISGFACYGSYLVGKAVWRNQVREMSCVSKDDDLTLGYRCAHPGKIFRIDILTEDRGEGCADRTNALNDPLLQSCGWDGQCPTPLAKNNVLPRTRTLFYEVSALLRN